MNKNKNILAASLAVVLALIACSQDANLPGVSDTVATATVTPQVNLTSQFQTQVAAIVNSTVEAMVPTSQIMIATMNLPTDPVFVGQSFSVSWDCQGAESVKIDRLGNKKLPNKGTESYTASVPGNIDFNLICKWSDETNVAGGVVTVLANPTTPTAEVKSPVVPEVDTDTVSEVTTANDWVITWLPGADLDKGDGTTFRQFAETLTWRKVAPEKWREFPNVPNPLAPEFPVVTCKDDPTKKCVPDGMEYAMNESNFCQQLAGEDCRVPVAARHYLYFTGDYNIPGIGAGEGKDGDGNMLVLVNMGDVTADITGYFAQGFRLHARYFNGDHIDMGLWGLTSYGANVMLDLNSPLNPEQFTNAGANCSVPTGCKKVHIRIVFMSGNELLLMLETTVSK